MFVHFKFCLLSISIIFTSACSSKLAAPDLSRFPAGGGTVSLDYKADRIAGIDFEFYSIGLIEYPKKIVNNQTMLLVVHSSDLTEPKQMLKANIQSLSKKFSGSNFSQLQLAMNDELRTNRADIYPLSYSAIWPFEGDSHRISHSGNRLILTGGNLTRCLCTALNSYVALSRSSNNQSSVYLPMDAIYEGYFRDPKVDEADQHIFSNLTESMTDQEFLDFIMKRLVGTERFCPDNSINFLRNPARTYQITIERNGNVLATVGNGNYRVRLVFLMTSHLLQRTIL